MSSKRGSRGGSKSSHGVCISMSKLSNPRQATLDLLGTIDVKPRINDIMPIICSRLERERSSRSSRRMVKGSDSNWSDSMLYNCMGEDGYGLSELDLLRLYGGGSKHLKRLNKKLFGRGKKRYSAYDVGGSDEDDFYWKNRQRLYADSDEWGDSDNGSGYKCIKFYHDIQDEFSCEEFDSLKSFNDFCESHGYSIGDTDLSNLRDWSVIHCCLDPLDLGYGLNNIITDSSYGGLYWTVSDDLTKKCESGTKL